MMITLGIAPGPNKPFRLDSFIRPFINEVNELSTRGMKVKKNGQIVYAGKVFLLGITGDIPGIASIMRHRGHTAKYGCRICKAVGAPPEDGRGMYFRSEGATRTKQELMSTAQVSSIEYLSCCVYI